MCEFYSKKLKRTCERHGAWEGYCIPHFGKMMEYLRRKEENG